MKKTINCCLSKRNCLKNIINTKAFFIIVFPFFSYFVSAQNDFRPGNYITRDNDTVFGFIDYRGEVKNSASCIFKENKDSEAIRLTPEDIQSYRFTNSKYYISKKIKIEGEEKQVFLEFLVDGIINLYFYRDINNYMYLIEGEDGQVTELTNETKTEYSTGRGEFQRQSYKYIGQLKAILADCKEIRNDIDKVALGHESLINITKEYHDYMCDDEQCIVYEKQVQKSKIRIAPLIGGGISSLHFDTGKFSNFSFEQNQSPAIGLLMNISLPKLNERLSIEVEGDFSKLDFHGSYIDDRSNFRTDYYNAYINVVSFQSSLVFKYTFGNHIIKPTVAAGIYSNFLLSPDKKVTKKSVHPYAEYYSETYEIPLASNIFGVLLQAGCNFEFQNRTLFTNVKICQTALKEAGVSTIINSANISFGMYLSKN